MNIPSLEKWTWIAIFAGIVTVAFGLSVRAADAVLGWGIVVGGALMVLVGLVMIVVRSRLPD